MSNPTRFGIGPSFKLTNALGYDETSIVGDAVGSNTRTDRAYGTGLAQVPFDISGAPVDLAPDGTVIDGGGTLTFTNPGNANDEDGATAAYRGAYVDNGVPNTSILRIDLGSAQTVSSMVIVGAAGGTDPAWDAPEWSSDGSTWNTVTNASGSWTLATVTDTITFDSQSARYWRLTQTNPSVPFLFFPELSVWTWQVIGSENVTTWQPGPLVIDADDDTYHLVPTAISGAVARVALDDEYRIAEHVLTLGRGPAGAQTYSIYGGNAADFSDADFIASGTHTAAGSYAGEQFSITAAGSNGFRYYRLDGAADVRVYSWAMYEELVADASEVQAALDAHLTDPTDAHDASAISIVDAGAYFSGATVEAALQELGPVAAGSNFVTRTRGGQSTVVTIAASGSSRTLDFGGGNVFDITLTANCTLAFSNAPTSGREGSILLVLRQDGTGNRTVTWPGSVTWAAGSAPTLSTGASQVDFVVLETFDGGTVWFGFPVGGGGTSSPLTTKGDLWGYTTIDARIAVGSNGTGIIADASNSAGLRWTTQQIAGELLMQDGVSSPPVPIETETGTDWLYSDL